MAVAAIEAEGLRKRYGTVEALRGVDLTVETGTVFGLLGPNGAGKTTALRILTTLLKPDSGTARVHGIDVLADAALLRGQIGVAGQNAAVDENMTGLENLEMAGRLYHMGRQATRERASELLDEFDLADAGDRVVKTYSGGMRRRLDLGSALIGRPRILFMDEPTTGLDPRSRLGMWEVIRGLVREGTTLLLTTQYLEEADALADQIAVVDHGRIIARGTADELKAQVGGAVVEVVVHTRADLVRAQEVLSRDCEGQCTVVEHTRKLSVPARAGASVLVQVVRDLDEAGIAIDDIGLRRPTVDDVFVSLTGHAAIEAAADDEAAATA